MTNKQKTDNYLSFLLAEEFEGGLLQGAENSLGPGGKGAAMLAGERRGSPTFAVTPPTSQEYAGVTQQMAAETQGQGLDPIGTLGSEDDVQEMIAYSYPELTEAPITDPTILEITSVLQKHGYDKFAELIEEVQRNPDSGDAEVIEGLCSSLYSSELPIKTVVAIREFAQDVKVHLALYEQGIESKDVISGKVVLTEEQKTSLLSQING